MKQKALPHTEEEIESIQFAVNQHLAEAQRLKAQIGAMRQANFAVKHQNEKTAAQRITPKIAEYLTMLSREDARLSINSWRNSKNRRYEIHVTHHAEGRMPTFATLCYIPEAKFSQLRTAGYIQKWVDDIGKTYYDIFTISDEGREALAAWNAENTKIVTE